ncbi:MULTISPECIES: SDR family NAD(P)-dependent oxidoreductase [Sphingobium]|uniref:SDR family NAD(P)-dependent oxidoreductase n=1 Tax=Sphingobium sp. MI1205 TaxID=407020 RepID=UPI00076FFFC6|nr:SDR family oxidoreductase [Sphingobium sp. MI1205]AMK19976.1 dehydrogenase [Sphingobium sp. MI1205]
MNRLEGRCAIVTGAARGLGLGIAQRLRAEGARLLLLDILADELAQTCEALGGGDLAIPLVIDLTAPDAPDTLLAAVAEKLGQADILVNNAGIGISGTIEQFDDAQWSRTIAINLTAPFRLTRALVPGMAERGHGRIINISSMNGSIGARADTAYAVTKAGLEALTRSVAADYGRFGVTCNAVAPGSITTPLNRDILASLHPRDPLLRIAVLNKPITGNGDMEDIGAAVAYLASDDAKFVSAQVLAVDGGLSGTRYVPDDEGVEQARYLPRN